MDWQQYKNKNIGSNSDSRRLISYKVGWTLIKENLPFGVGTGSLQKEMDAYYEVHYPEMKIEDRIAPHNQMMYTLLDYGILGLIALMFTLFYPIYLLRKKKQNLFYILFWIVACTPLLFDISLEMQIGITFFALFSSLILKQISIREAYV